MRVAIHQPNYFPWLGFFAKAMQADVLVLLNDVQLEKPSFTTRCAIKGPEGRRWLSVPLRHRSGEPKIRKVEVDGLDWIRDHRNHLHACYGRGATPILDTSLEIYTPNRTLFGFNLDSLRWMLRVLEIDVQIVFSERFPDRPGGPNDGNLNLCMRLGADTYVSGHGAKAYQVDSLFEAKGIKLEYSRFKHPVYPQFHGDFLPGLSVLDALCCVGVEETKRLLKESIA